MLPKKNRLTREIDFKKVYRNSRKISGSFLSLRKIKNHKEDNRFGVVVPNYVAKKASRRNLIKRIIRVYIEKEKNNFSSGYDIIIKAERDASKQEDLLKDLDKLTKNLND